jgi:hypothetical protein
VLTIETIEMKKARHFIEKAGFSGCGDTQPTMSNETPLIDCGRWSAVRRFDDGASVPAVVLQGQWQVSHGVRRAANGSGEACDLSGSL